MGLPYPDSHADPVNERDIAEAACAVLTDPALRGRSYHLTGPQSLTFAEHVAIIAAAAGRDIPVERIPRRCGGPTSRTSCRTTSPTRC